MRTGVSFGEKLLAMIFPSRCAICGKITIGGKRICGKCEEENPPQSYFRRLDEEGNAPIFCVSPYVYSGEVRKAILAMKFYGRKERAAGFAEALARVLPPRWQTDDVVCWAPISQERLRERGYDQSELVARRLARELGRPCRPLLRKIKNNRVQHELHLEERRRNVQGVYAAEENRVRGKRILLIDDIVTSGSTLRECANCLLAAGAIEVHCAAIADAFVKEVL
ncbi:MAG TPA: ComF family protein [Candidatus Gallacutalibacter pullistercoris]|nr:ComF family protein [Candidatus Gallacutalibacter pullistercoris]